MGRAVLRLAGALAGPAPSRWNPQLAHGPQVVPGSGGGKGRFQVHLWFSSAAWGWGWLSFHRPHSLQGWLSCLDGFGGHWRLVRGDQECCQTPPDIYGAAPYLIPRRETNQHAASEVGKPGLAQSVVSRQVSMRAYCVPGPWVPRGTEMRLVEAVGPWQRGRAAAVEPTSPGYSTARKHQTYDGTGNT